MEHTDFLNKILELGYKPLLAKNSAQGVASIISVRETILSALEGTLTGIHTRGLIGTGIAVLTDKRVVFYRKKSWGTEIMEEIPIHRVTSASYRKGLLSSSIKIVASNNDANILNCDKRLAEKFILNVQRLISSFSGAEANKKEEKVSKIISTAEQLEKLFELKEKGVLSEEEYKSEKTKLLNKE